MNADTDRGLVKSAARVPSQIGERSGTLPADAKRIVDASLEMLRFSTALRTRRPRAKPRQKKD